MKSHFRIYWITENGHLLKLELKLRDSLHLSNSHCPNQSLSKDVQGMKPLIDIWSNAINNEEAFTSSKEKTAETIRLTPIEQADLYEILSQDKAKVLESYLKGENNDPKDIMLHLKLSIRSLYFLIAEEKNDSNKITVDSKKITFHPETKSWHLRNPTPRGDKVEIPKFDAIEEIHMKRNDQQKLHLHGQPIVKEPTDDSFMTAPNEEEKFDGNNKDSDSKRISSLEMDSFFDHLKDIDEGTKNHFKVDHTEPNKEKDAKQDSPLIEGRRELSDWWNQNLILLVEILDIGVDLMNYRNGGLRTEKPLTCKTLMVTTALNLPKAVTQRDIQQKAPLDLGFCLKYDILMQRILAYDFTFAIPDTEGTANPLIKYLKEKECGNIAAFLEIYNKDKKSTGLIVSKMDDYKPFFERTGPFALKLPEKCLTNFKNYLAYGSTSKETKENIITEAYQELEKHINENILPLFLYSYGVLVIPLMFQAEQISSGDTDAAFQNTEIDQKEIKSWIGRLKRFPTKIRNINITKFLKRKTEKKPTQKEEKEGIIDLKFSIEGTQSQFKIQRVDNTFRKKKSDKHDDDDYAEQKENSYLKFNFQPFRVFLSVESMRPIVQFVSSLLEEPENSFKQWEQHSKEDLSVDEFQSLMNCINYNPSEQTQTRFQDLPMLDASLRFLELEVTNFNSHYIHDRRLTFTLSNLNASVIPPQKIPRESANVEIEKLEKENLTTMFRIEKLQMAEWYKSGDEDIEKVILHTKIAGYRYDCIYENHPLHTDRKMHIIIPFIRVQVDDNNIMITELLQIIRGFTEHFAPKPKEPVQPRDKFFIAMGQNQRTILTNRLKSLLLDHKLVNKNCKHCILRYKKSSLIMNLFIGNINDYFPDIEQTTFANLNNFGTSLTEDGISGLAIGIDHSLTLKPVSHLKTLVYLPFLSITRDVGFFKDNTAVHCTESMPFGPRFENSENSHVDQDHEAVLVKFVPTIKVDKSVIGQFDDHFWKYHRNLEKKIATRDEDNTLEEMNLRGSGSVLRSSGKKAGTFVVGSVGYNQKKTGKPEFDYRHMTSNLYVLLFRKEYLRKEILKEFELSAHTKSFSNSFILRIKEVEFKFNNLIGLCSVLNTLDNLSYLGSWFEAFYQKHSSMRRVDLFVPNGEEEKSHPSGPMTHEQFLNVINKENISIMVDKLSLNIMVKQPTSVVSLEIKKFMFENFPDKAFLSSIGQSDQTSIKILALESINFRTNAKALGSIEDVSLIYHQKYKRLDFNVRRIFHERPTKKNEFIIQLPAEKDFHNKGASKKALSIQLHFEDDKLGNIEVIVAPINLFLSHNDVSEEFSSLALFSNLFSKEKATLPQIIMSSVFEKELFKIFHERVILKNKLKHVSDEKNNNSLSFTVFAANPKMTFDLRCERLICKCEKLGQQFLVFSSEGIELVIDVNNAFTLSFKKVSIQPADSLYQEILTPLSDKHQLSVKIFKQKQDDFPTLAIHHGKLLFLHRALKELIEFRKELQAEISSSARALLNTDTVAYGDDLENAQKQLKSQEFDTENIFQMNLIDCVVVVPRNSKSQDLVVLKAKQCISRTSLRCLSMEMPQELRPPFDVVDGDQVMSLTDNYQRVRGAYLHTDVDCQELKLYCCASDRHNHLGDIKAARLTVVTGDEDIVKDGWLFDLLLHSKLEDFSVVMNHGALEEFRNIVKENSKELSPLFPIHIKVWEKTQVGLKGTDLMVGIDKYLMPVEVVKPLYESRKLKPDPIQEKDEYTKHLENVLDDMLFSQH